MEGEEGVRHKDRTAIHGAVNVSSSLTSSTNNWCIDGIDRHRGWTVHAGGETRTGLNPVYTTIQKA